MRKTRGKMFCWVFVLAFLFGALVHVYLTTTGPTLMSHIRSMITAYDDHA